MVKRHERRLRLRSDKQREEALELRSPVDSRVGPSKL